MAVASLRHFRPVSTPRQDLRQNPEFGWNHLPIFHARYRFAYDAALSSSKRFRTVSQSVSRRTQNPLCRNLGCSIHRLVTLIRIACQTHRGIDVLHQPDYIPLYPVLMVGSQYRQRHSPSCSKDSHRYFVMIGLKRKPQKETYSTGIISCNLLLIIDRGSMAGTNDGYLCVPWPHCLFVKIELALPHPELAQIVQVIAKWPVLMRRRNEE